MAENCSSGMEVGEDYSVSTGRPGFNNPFKNIFIYQLIYGHCHSQLHSVMLIFILYTYMYLIVDLLSWLQSGSILHRHHPYLTRMLISQRPCQLKYTTVRHRLTAAKKGVAAVLATKTHLMTARETRPVPMTRETGDLQRCCLVSDLHRLLRGQSALNQQIPRSESNVEFNGR